MTDARERYADQLLARRGRTRKRAYRAQRPAVDPVFVSEKSASSKLGPVSVTHASQVTCPQSCPFMGAGCYAENGFLGGFITKRLNASGEYSPEAVALIEAGKIDHLTGTRDLRLHVVGDSTTDGGTRILAAAAERYIARGGRRVWTYTHAWREVDREAWGPISVLASCETQAQAAEAHARGYATAMVVERHDGDALRDGVLPCPEQTRGVQCSDCRLCMDDGRLQRESITIAFAVHGKRGVALAALATSGDA